MTSSYITSEMVPIGTFLANTGKIRVPAFQRSYAWTDDEVTLLWLDITEALGSEQTEYFLGPMVMKQGPDYLEIIDGQQRVTTVLIMLSAIRRAFRQQGDENRADWFRNRYFGEQDVDTLQVDPKFHMNEENNHFYRQYIKADVTDDKIKEEMKGKLQKDSNYLLLQAVLRIQALTAQWQKDQSSESFCQEALLSLHRYLQNSVFILILKVEDEADAYVIFETLNDRGRGLNTMDLLKNHLFGRSGDLLGDVKRHWATIKDSLADIDPGERFLYHYWTSYYGRTSKNKLFRLMRSRIEASDSALRFSSDLCNAAKLYAALSVPGHPHWNGYDQRTRENLETLSLLDAQQALPILLAAADSFSEQEFGKLTHILVVMAVRYNLIGELRTGVAANFYSDIPPMIRANILTKSSKVFHELKPLYPSDSDFEQAFRNKVLRNSEKARYILRQIERYLHDNKTEVASDTKHVNLEHILPRNPSQEWSATIDSFGPDEIDEYTSRIGNLALVSSTENKKAGSRSFEEKKRNIFQKEQNIITTQRILEYPTWSRQQIEERQDWLAQLATQVWRVEMA